jgi:hypothetical protein
VSSATWEVRRPQEKLTVFIEAIVATWTRPDVLFLAGLSLLLTFLWRVPFLGMIFYPFRLLNTFVHELSHGFAALITGGRFDRFVVHPNREGLAHIRGGNRFIVVSAGYLGPALFGGALILLSATEIAVQTILLGLGLGLAIACMLFVRNVFGFATGLLLAASLAAAGWFLADRAATFLFALLAMQMPLAAANSLIDLVRISMGPPGREQLSDAQVMARVTHIPAVVWALLWLVIAVVIVVVTVTIAYGDTYLL